MVTYPKGFIYEAKKDPQVVAVVLFGSQARGEAGPLSDLDIAIIAPSLSVEGRLRLRGYGSENIDIVFFDELPLSLKKRILEEGKILFNKNQRLLDDLLWTTFKEYLDFGIHRARLIENYLPGVSYV